LDSKLYKVTAFETSMHINITPYNVVSSMENKEKEKNKYFQYFISFENNISPSLIDFRPGGIKGKHNYAVSFDGGLVGIFHYESQALVSLFKTSYGNVICLDYSKDGRLLALGCEDDNIYIADAENNSLLYTLQGHENYVSSVRFEEKYEENKLDQINNITQKNKISKPKNEKKFYKEQIDLDEFIENISEINMNTEVNINHVNKKSSKINISSKNLIYNEFDFISNYSLFSASYDGSIATWQIEYSYHQNFINKSNFFTVNNTNKPNVLDFNLKIISLEACRENLITPISHAKICPVQIYDMIIVNNLLIYLAKTNHEVSDVYFRIYFSKINQENNNSNNTNDVNNINSIKSNYEEMNTPQKGRVGGNSLLSTANKSKKEDVLNSTASSAIKLKK
jgi:hypothetical protein